LPFAPLEPCEKQAAPSHRRPLVRYRGNDYSVDGLWLPGHHREGFVDQVVILCGGAEIARHRRCYGSGMFVFDLLHYLALIARRNRLPYGAASVRGGKDNQAHG
jgi:hypothetical protein